MKFNPRQIFSENKGFLFFVAAMILMRSALADWYVVPSGSMYPHLMEGDRVIANRIAYDIRVPFTDIILKQVADPQRGDIVTFISPEDGKRLVKRVMGLPGDVLEMVDEQLIINGVKAEYDRVKNPDTTMLIPQREYTQEQIVLTERFGSFQHNIIITPDRQAVRNFGPYTIPPGHYMMFGDNRDNSNDSRFIGFIKREAITGRVKHLMFSLDYDNYYLPRLERIGAKVGS